MDALFVGFLLLNLLVLSSANPTVEVPVLTTTPEPTILTTSPHPEQKSRTSRKLFSKIHTGIAFLTGVKVGSLLSHKGFDVGHGSVASSHSFQLFGKPINSALSLSYGGVSPYLPLLDEQNLPNSTYSVHEKPEERRGSDNKENIIHVTLIQNPTLETFEKLKSISSTDGMQDTNRIIPEEETAEVRKNNETAEEKPVLFQDFQKSERSNNFLKEHNRRVQQFNNNLARRNNSKF